MFVGDEMRLEVGFDAARAGLANLAHRGLLTSASAEAYGEGLTGVAGVGPLRSVPGVSKLVKVHFRDLLVRGDCAVLALRWEATGPAGRLFPALDADITLVPAGPQATLLRIAGAYRPPLGFLGAGLDRAVLHRVATATIRDFISRVADSIGPGPAPARTPGNDETRPAETGGPASGGAAPGAS